MEGQSSGRAPPWTEKMEGAGVEGQSSSHTPPPTWTERMEGAGGEGQSSRRGTLVPFNPPFRIKGGTPGLTPDTAGKGSWKGTAGAGRKGGKEHPPHA